MLFAMPHETGCSRGKASRKEPGGRRRGWVVSWPNLDRVRSAIRMKGWGSKKSIPNVNTLPETDD